MKKYICCLTVTFIVGILVFSCGNDKAKQMEQLIENNNKIIQSLKEKYNAISDWDTTYYQYSVLFEDKLKSENRPF